MSLAGWALEIHPLSLYIVRTWKKIPRPGGLVSWIEAPRPMGAPTIPVLGTSTMARTSQGSPSVAVLPPDEGAVLADVASRSSAVVPFSQTVLWIDVSCDLHPFFVHKLDAGPIWLVTIAHAFNYRVAVSRDGVKSAIRVGRSRKAEGQILSDMDISWGHQVAVMFQIFSMLALDMG